MWKRLHTNVNGKEIRGVDGGDIKGTYGEAARGGGGGGVLPYLGMIWRFCSGGICVSENIFLFFFIYLFVKSFSFSRCLPNHQNIYI